MGCVPGKTNQIDDCDTESTISTVSYRGKTLPYDDYWTEQEKQEEREIEAELEGKKLLSEKPPPKYSIVSNPNGNRVPDSQKSGKKVSLNKEKVPLKNSEKGKARNDDLNEVNNSKEAKDSGKHSSEDNNRSSNTKKQQDENKAEEGGQGPETREKFSKGRGDSFDETEKAGNPNSQKHSANRRERGNIAQGRQTSANKGKVGTEKTNTNRKLIEQAKENANVDTRATGEEKDKLKDNKQNNSETKEGKSEKGQVKKNGTLQNDISLKENIGKQNLPKDEKDSVDGRSTVPLQDHSSLNDDSIIDISDKDNSEDIDMGNAGSNTEVKLNGHAESPDKDTDKTAEEQADDHHVHWKDDSKVKNGPGNASVRAVSAKLMPQPSERVMSAHVRRGSVRQSAGKERMMSAGKERMMSAGKERRMSRGMSARRDRSASARYSARRQRRESKAASETNGKDVTNNEHRMDADTTKTPEEIIEERLAETEAADNYADVEQMIQDEPDKDDEEDDIDSFTDDDISSSQMTDRAPSLSLWYDDNVPGDILTTQVYVPSFGLTRFTYYCCLQWNSGKNGGGYCGLQDHDNGRNYIFSIWDPIDGEGKIKPVYIGPGTTCEPFGGEGTGLKSWNFDLGWEPDCWYTLVTRRWDHEGHTRYGLWVKHHLECFWTHIVTVDFPLPGIYYDTWTCSFIEDWEGSGHRVRRAHMRNGFKRKLNGQWVPFDKAVLGMVKETASRRYRGNFDAGTFDEMFFLQSGGETIPAETVSEGSCFYSVSDDKPTEVPISCVLTTVTGMEMVWEVSEGSVPQFRYAIKIDGELYKQEINSEMRVCKFESPPQKLVEIYVEDILGRTANAKFVVREKLKVKVNPNRFDR